jgi:hypothetical protein
VVGVERKLSVTSLSGDGLKVTGPTGQTITWKKSPPLQQVAAVPAAAQQQTLKQQIQGAWNLVSWDAKKTLAGAETPNAVWREFK